MPYSLDYTVESFYCNELKCDSYIVTGDIKAMWIRDSINQLSPYIPYIPVDPGLGALVGGLITRLTSSILEDPFANAFNYDSNGHGFQTDIRNPPMKPTIYEGKYEIDSLCSFLKVSYWYWKYTKDYKMLSYEWFEAVQRIVSILETMRHDNNESEIYRFQRLTTSSTDTLHNQGRGPPAKPCGLSRSLFRPSDDAVTFPYHIPGNAMACTELKHIMEMFDYIKRNAVLVYDIYDLADSVAITADGICNALQKRIGSKHSSLLRPSSSLPYEIDGFGNSIFMDDPNVPSLLSLPVLGYLSANHPVYRETRTQIMSESNPYWCQGSLASGFCSQHERGLGYIWPIGTIVTAMTSDNDTEVGPVLCTAALCYALP